MAEEKPYLTGRTYIFRLPKGKDLLESLADFCHEVRGRDGNRLGGERHLGLVRPKQKTL